MKTETYLAFLSNAEDFLTMCHRPALLTTMVTRGTENMASMSILRRSSLCSRVHSAARQL